MTTHLVRLQFAAGGPAVTGEWADGTTARRTWRDWVGRYGSDEKVVIRLAEGADGGERVLMAWERGQEVETDSDGPAATEKSGLPGCGDRPERGPGVALAGVVEGQAQRPFGVCAVHRRVRDDPARSAAGRGDLGVVGGGWRGHGCPGGSGGGRRGVVLRGDRRAVGLRPAGR
ncbi:hypothetical protein [Streptomyces diastatochromogenes]|uniref:hypothetical protein n=1 Tax=Streptomyces diastatochromogenes TaxID=42236 RepID=UPI001ABFF66E|nr:hypothetical protein [Streptomyces diastatochromogenes]